MKRENRIVEVIIGPVATRSHHQGARDEKTDTGMTRSESKLGPPDRREEEETKNEKKRGDMKNGNGNVKLHVNVSVTHKGSRSWMRLGNRRGWLTDEDSSDEKRSCNRKEIVWTNWKTNEPARESNVNGKEPEQGRQKGGWKLVRVSCLRTQRTFLHDPYLLPTPESHHKGILT